ncbi:hypothetical protein [Thermocrinis sp.]|jgi:hypothetical protein|uniref:hypothetical protein n=1 Tax=Thermocrinis sp. TaxID=2024383 RepID=UPI003BFE9794
MELLILLIIALILLAWRINSEMSAIRPPIYPLVQKKQEEQLNFVPTEDEENRMRKHSSVDDSYNVLLTDSFSSSSLLDNDSTSSHDIYTDPSYCHLSGNIYYHICHDDDDDDDDDDSSRSSDDYWSSSNWDDWTSSGSNDWGSSSGDSWSSSSWDS